MMSTKLSVLGGLLALFAVSACKPPARKPLPPPTVVIAKPTMKTVRNAQVLVGTTESSEYVEVRARVAGFLKSVDFTPGDMVKEGQVLFHIEPNQYSAQVDVAKAQVSIQEAELARAEADLKRVNKAAQNNAVSEQEVDFAQAAREKAAGSLAAAEADLQVADLNLDYTKVVSPIAGKVSRNQVTVGNLVGASGQTTLLTTVAALEPIYVYFDMPERFVVDYLRRHSAEPQKPEKMKERYPVSVALEGDEGFPHVGWIDFVNNEVNKSTGTITLRALLPNKDLTVYPGMFTKVRMEGQPIPDAVIVETTAVGTDLGGKYVNVVGENNIVQRQHVTLGEQLGDMQVVTKGLTKDANYVVEGMVRVRPGSPVIPMTREQFAKAQAEMKQKASQASQSQKQGG
ncbi:MAG: efflux RND transporter periplasmic adaptor subunit [Planctomycetota bacterium]|nr:efflux RND transporter periplasmic adaptor subunit [Planctomycetota bacterium]